MKNTKVVYEKKNQNGGSWLGKFGSMYGPWRMGDVDKEGEDLGVTGAVVVGEVGTGVVEGS